MSIHRLCCCNQEPGGCPPNFGLQATVLGLDNPGGGGYPCRKYDGLQSAQHWARIDELQNVDGVYSCNFLNCGTAIDPRTGDARNTAQFAIDFPSGQNAWLAGVASRAAGCNQFTSTNIITRCGPWGRVVVYTDPPVELASVVIRVGATFQEPLGLGNDRREFFATVFDYRHLDPIDTPDILPPGTGETALNVPGSLNGALVPGCQSSPLAFRVSTGQPTGGAGSVIVEFDA